MNDSMVILMFFLLLSLLWIVVRSASAEQPTGPLV